MGRGVSQTHPVLCFHLNNLFLYAARLYGAALANYGVAREGSDLTKWLTISQKKDLLLQYFILTCHFERLGLVTKKGRVRALERRWAVARGYCHKALVALTRTAGVKLTKNVRKNLGVKIMDKRENHDALVRLMIERKDGMSNRQLQRAFNKRTGNRQSTSQIQAKLSRLGATKHKVEMRPKLKRQHRIARKIFAMSMLDNRFHWHFDIDEKLFYTKSINGYVWVLPDHMTDGEIREIKEKHMESKSHITKVMVVTAVGRPIHNDVIDFDGKLFMTRCSVPYTAKQDSVHHKKGERYDKDVNVNGELYVHIIKQMLARITSLFGKYYPNAIITIQHDGAGPHRSLKAEKEVTRLGEINVPMVVFVRQNPQSPEQNANDLAVYRHLGAVVAEFDYRTADELMDAIIAAWQAIPENLLDHVFAMKCLVFKEIVRMDGHSIKIPHVGLRAAQGAGLLWEFIDEYMSY